MAHTEHLPIYKGCYDLCLYLEQVVHHFSRYQKYTLGADLRDGARRALKLVVRANARHDKVAVLLELREQLEELKVLLRLGQGEGVRQFQQLCPCHPAGGGAGQAERGLAQESTSGPGPESAGDAVRASHAERVMITGFRSRLPAEANAEVL